MQMDRRRIVEGLQRKGFEKDDTRDHTYFFFKVGDKYTGVDTHVSRGTGYKTLQDSLLAAMKRQLRLQSLTELCDLVNCPMSEERYRVILSQQGVALD